MRIESDTFFLKTYLSLETDPYNPHAGILKNRPSLRTNI